MIFSDIDKIAWAIEKATTPLWVTVLLAILPVVATCIIFWRQNKVIKAQLKIANQQNNIALFDKKYKLYCFFEKFISNIAGMFTVFPQEYFTNMDDSMTNESKIIKLTNMFYKINIHHEYRIYVEGTAYQQFVQEINFTLDQLGAIPYVFELTEHKKYNIKNIEKETVLMMNSVFRHKHMLKEFYQVIASRTRQESFTHVINTNKTFYEHLETLHNLLLEKKLLNKLKSQLYLTSNDSKDTP